MEINFREIFNANTSTERLNALDKFFRVCFSYAGTISNKYSIECIGCRSGFFSQFLCYRIFNSIHH